MSREASMTSTTGSSPQYGMSGTSSRPIREHKGSVRTRQLSHPESARLLHVKEMTRFVCPRCCSNTMSSSGSWGVGVGDRLEPASFGAGVR